MLDYQRVRTENIKALHSQPSKMLNFVEKQNAGLPPHTQTMILFTWLGPQTERPAEFLVVGTVKQLTSPQKNGSLPHEAMDQ